MYCFKSTLDIIHVIKTISIIDNVVSLSCIICGSCNSLMNCCCVSSSCVYCFKYVFIRVLFLYSKNRRSGRVLHINSINAPLSVCNFMFLFAGGSVIGSVYNWRCWCL